MKKIFYFLASAIVALGAMACKNEVDENINPNTQSDVVSFTVAFDEATRIAMTTEGKTANFAFEAGDKLYVQPHATFENDEVFEGNKYEFTTEDGETFSCQSAELVSELAQSGNYAFVDHSADGSIRSNEGVDGFNFATYADLTAETVTLPMSHAVFHFTVPEGTTATLKHTEDIFDTEAVVGWEKDMTFTEGEHWVAAWASTGGTLSYSINGVVVKSIEKDFEAGKIYNLGTLDTNMTIANVAALIEKAEAGSTITLPAGATITGSEILTISKNITINGNGATLSSTAGRAINIETDGEVNISDLTVVCSGERVFNIINKPATVNISGVTATATNYAIMVATSAGAAIVTVSESTLTGLSVVNVAGAGAQVTVTNCTLNCEDNNPNESYGALALYNTADDASIVATECDINVAGDSYKAWNSSKTGTITISDGEVVNAIAYIDYNNGYSYSFSSLAKAIKTAKGDDVIVLLQDAEMIAEAGTYNIDVNGKNLTAAEGYKLTIEGTTVTVEAMTAVDKLNEQIADGESNITISESFEMTATDPRINIAEGQNVNITLAEGVEITGTFAESGSDALFNIAKGGELTIGGEGKIALTAVKGNVSNYGQYIFENCGGVLNITGGTYTMEVTGSGSATWFIPTLINNNSTSGETVTNISGGYFYSETCINIMRQFINHKTATATFNITGGEFKGTGTKTYGIWNQNSGNSGLGYINISGNAKMNNVYVENDAPKANAVVWGGTFGYEPGTAASSYNAVTIKEGYKASENEGVWTVNKVYTVYVTAQPKSTAASWEKVNLYAWDETTNNTWPGTDITANTTTINDYTYHYFEFPANFNNKEVSVIVNNGTDQTDDIVLGTLNKDYYVVYSTVVKDVFTEAPAAGSIQEAETVIVDPKPETTTIYLQTSWSWANWALWGWTTDNGDKNWFTKSWPGETNFEEVVIGENTYKAWDVPSTVDKTKTNTIIISGEEWSQRKQTANFKVDITKDVFVEIYWDSTANQAKLRTIDSPYTE